MRKRFLSLAMIFVLPFAVAACGNYNIADENAPPQNVEEDPFAGVQEEGDLGFLSHGEANPARAMTRVFCLMSIMAENLSWTISLCQKENWTALASCFFWTESRKPTR